MHELPDASFVLRMVGAASAASGSSRDAFSVPRGRDPRTARPAPQPAEKQLYDDMNLARGGQHPNKKKKPPYL